MWQVEDSLLGGTTEYDANINNKDYWWAIVTYNVEGSALQCGPLGHHSPRIFLFVLTRTLLLPISGHAMPTDILTMLYFSRGTTLLHKGHCQ